MNLLASAKIDTPVYELPGTGNKLKTLNAGEQFKIIDNEKIGLKMYYKLNSGGFVNSLDVLILRDEDYFYQNYDSKNLMKHTIGTNGLKGLNSVIGESNTNLNSNYKWLQRFSGIGDFLTRVGTAAQKDAAIAQQERMDSYSNGIGDGASLNLGLPKIPMTVEAKTYDTNIENVSLYTGNNSTAKTLLNGINVGSVMDGSALGILAGNAINGLFGSLMNWGQKLVNFVIGFTKSSSLGNLFSLFGINFQTILGYVLSSLGGPAFNLISPYAYGNTGKSDTGDSTNYFEGMGWGVNIVDYNPVAIFDARGRFVGFDYPAKTLSFNNTVDSVAEYFKYNGTDGKKVMTTYAEFTWPTWGSLFTAEAYQMESKKPANEVAVWETLYNSTYSEFQDSFKLLREELNLDLSRDITYTKFNRFRVPIPDIELLGTIGHIFFIRPDLNLEGGRKLHRGDTNVKSSFSHYTRLFENMVSANSTLTKNLSADGFGDHNFMPILTHACTGIDVSDEILETTEIGETFVGWKNLYGTSMIKSKTAGTINVQFTDDDILSVYKLMKTWIEYIHAVRHGEIFPKDQYVLLHQLDYPTSIYYILTKSTDEEILFWTKYTGAFPISSPSSNFSDQLGQRIHRPNYSIQFAYTRKDDYNPLHLEEFNRQSTGSYEYMKIYNDDTMRATKSFVGAPFVDTTDGELTYRLRFRES